MATTPTRKVPSTAQEPALLLAFELGLQSWKLGFATDFTQRPRLREIAGGDGQAVLREIAEAKRALHLPPEVPVRSCYEAGRDGFWLHRFLQSHGIHNLVVDSSSIAVERRARQAKTDRLDVGNLLTLLLRHVAGEPGVWHVVHVPSAAAEDARALHRELRTLSKECTRSINRIKGLLMTQGIRLERLRRDFLPWLARVRLWDGTPLPAGLRGRIEREYERWQLAHRQILGLESQRREALRSCPEKAVEQTQRLQHLRGIGPESAWLYVREFFGWRHFRNRREIGALAGLTPTPYQSGDPKRERGIRKAGNRYVRGLAVEIAWGWLPYQPTSALSRWYRRRFGQGGPRQRKIGIVARARKLLIALWQYLERGIVPEGAKLKA